MITPSRHRGPRAAASALVFALFFAGLGEGARGDAPFDVLRLDSVKPTAGGFEVAMSVGEDELAEIGLRAMDDYLRAHRPRLFSNFSLGVVRYRNARITPRELRVVARPDSRNTLDVDIRADIVVDKQERELVCELEGWRSRCETRWLDRGSDAIASIEASGELGISLRPGAVLREKPLTVEIYLGAIRGSVHLAALTGVGLEIGFDPPYHADSIDVGLPDAAKQRLRRFGGLVVRDLRIAPGPERHIEIAATVARR